MLAPIVRLLFHDTCLENAENVPAVNLGNSILHLHIKGLHHGLSSCDVYTALEWQLFSIGVPGISVRSSLLHFPSNCGNCYSTALSLHKSASNVRERFLSTSTGIEVHRDERELCRIVASCFRNLHRGCFFVSFLDLPSISMKQTLLRLTAID